MAARELIMEVLEEPRVVRHRLSVDDYARMTEAGVLAHDARVELIDGEVIEIAPIGSRHYAAVSKLDRWLQRAVQDQSIVVTQAPIRLSTHSEPEPDVVLLKPRVDFYEGALPTGTDTLLVIEVSDTTLAYDVRIKAPLYARFGVPEYWVVDITNGLLRIFRDPQGGQWLDVTATAQPALMALPGLPGCSVDLTGLF
jgi:Uma2 family endonuclease